MALLEADLRPIFLLLPEDHHTTLFKTPRRDKNLRSREWSRLIRAVSAQELTLNADNYPLKSEWQKHGQERSNRARDYTYPYLWNCINFPSIKFLWSGHHSCTNLYRPVSPPSEKAENFPRSYHTPWLGAGAARVASAWLHRSKSFVIFPILRGYFVFEKCPEDI